ncbi:hypothetical protein ACFQZR_01870 [Paenibacillus sp. GCM10027629]|uniref:hypothetical protein n=1 Tax=Paenibacillus sp. GCM10027629 TaxID=3273414 RepID=UPI00362ED4A6
MANLLRISNMNTQYPQSQFAASLASRIQNIRWYSAYEQQGKPLVTNLLEMFGSGFGISDFTVRWLSLDELSAVIDEMNLAESPLWGHLSPIPERIRQAAEAVGQQDEFVFIFNDFMEIVFHAAYDGAYRAFGSCGEKTLNYAVGSALYVSALAVGWAKFAEAGQLGDNPFLPLVAVFESGYWPIGLYKNQFYVQ